jgi:hypothetical protein
MENTPLVPTPEDNEPVKFPPPIGGQPDPGQPCATEPIAEEGEPPVEPPQE